MPWLPRYKAMGFAIGLIVIIVVIALVLMSRSGRNRLGEALPPPTKEESLEIGWLQERWGQAEKEREAAALKMVPAWFFDDVTDRQLHKLEQIGVRIKSGRLTKGQASDLIGLSEPVEEENEEILRFFKIPMKGMNQTRGRYEVAKLLADPERKEAWQKRPATPMQKEFYRYFGFKLPTGLAHDDASQFISNYETKHAEDDEERLKEWEAYEIFYDVINDPDFRDTYDIRKVSLPVYRAAIEELKREGMKLSELDVDDDEEAEVIVEKIKEMKPELEKE